MADNVQTIGADASQLIAELAKIQAGFNSHNKSVEDAANTYVNLTKTTKGFKAEFSTINAEGQRVEGTLKRVNGEWQAQAKSISQTTDALKQMKAAQAVANLEQAKVIAQSAITKNTNINAQPVPDRAIAPLRAAQAKLAESLSSDFANSGAIAQEMFDKLRKGVVDVESGIRLKIQGAVASLLTVERQITREIEKQNTTSGPSQSVLAAASQASAAKAAQAFVTGQAGVSGVIPANTISALRTAQSQLAKALGSDLATSVPIAKEIFDKLKVGVVETEFGIRERIQKALTNVLTVSEKISREQAKIASPSAPSNTIQPAQLSGLKTNLATQFPVPTNASLSSVIAFQRALDNLINQAAKGKLTFEELVAVINKVKADPRAVTNLGPDGDKIAGATQKVVQGYGNMQRAAKDAENQGIKTGTSLFLSFDQFVKLIEIQVIHRAFGSLITAMQSSIGKAAELQVRISEIRTVSQTAGIGFDELQTRVRALSDSFGKNQLDVAEAAYQGFSNQVIKTSADIHVLNDVLNLSRITNSSVAASMEALSSVINAYRLNTFQAATVSAQLFKAVELGRFRLEDVANSMGRITVVASQLSVSFPEVSGLLAQLTVNGVSADEAMTQISSIMQALLKPTDALKKVFQDLGVENGQAAIQTFGFVGVLQRLFSLAQKGNQDLAALFPNVRALRGVLGGTAGGNTNELQDTIDQIRTSGQSAAAASGIIAESAGDRLRKEFNKIQNFFISDFGNGIINAIERLTAPFGGLAEVVKSFGRSIIDTFAAVDNFGTILGRIATLGGTVGVNLELIVKSYIAYKAAVIGANIASAASIAVQQIDAALKLKAGTVQVASTALTWADVAAKIAQTAATVGNAVASGFWVVASTIYSGVVTTLIFLDTELTLAKIAQTAASIAQAGASGLLTAATVGLAGASAVLSVAMKAIPFIALAAAVLYAVGAFDSLIERFTAAGQAQIKLREISGEIQRAADAERENNNRNNARDAQDFTADLGARTNAASRVLAELRRASNGLVEAQREAVKTTEEQVAESLDRVKRSMGDGISELSRQISEFHRNIQSSLKHEASFADREASRAFQAQLDATGQQADVKTGLKPFTQREAQIETFQRTSRNTAALNQQALIQDRINTLQREATAATNRGDQEGIEIARRKFEEIRRLITQQEEIRRNEGRAQASDIASDTARQTGQFVTATFDNGLQRLRERLRQIQEEEARAEQLFRSQQAERQQAAEDERRKRQLAQDAFVRASRDLARLQREAINADGTVNERFRDRPGEQRGAGLDRFRAEFDAVQERLRRAGSEAGADPIAVEQAIVQLGAHRIALEQQISRTITNNAIAETQRQVQEQARLLQEAATSEQRALQQAQEARTTLLPRLTGQLGDVDRTAATLAGQVNRRQTREDGSVETDAQMAERIRLFGEAQAEFNRARLGLQDLIRAASTATTAETQAATIRALQERATQLTEALQRLGGLGAGTARVGNEDFTGNQVANGGAQANFTTSVQRLAAAQTNLTQAITRLEELRKKSEELQTQLLALSPEMRLIAAGLGEAGIAAQAQVDAFRGFAGAVSELNRQIDALRQQPPLVIPPLPAANPNPAPAGGNAGNFVDPNVEGNFAEGGLIGNVFTSKGPDDTLVMAKRGEFIVNPASTRQFHSVLTAINAGHFPRHYSNGGVVNSTTLGDVTIHVDGSKSPSTTARAVMQELKREKRRGNGGF